MRISVANQITLGRLLLAIVFFGLLMRFDAAALDRQRWLLVVCFWVFLAAALGDVLDGMLARMLKQVTSFGRIVDPVVDKVMVVGAFIFFASPQFSSAGRNITDVAPWMVVVVLVRELLVSAIRSHVESAGQNFAAARVGKLKMFVQCTTVCVILGQLGFQLESLAPLRSFCVWSTVIVTIVSAISYVRRARTFLLETGTTKSGAGAAPLDEGAGPGAPRNSRPEGRSTKPDARASKLDRSDAASANGIADSPGFFPPREAAV
jgi:CDP-diacylglycerol--glycerol-3-phosphate 3-phosphatidyltransferase